MYVLCATSYASTSLRVDMHLNILILIWFTGTVGSALPLTVQYSTTQIKISNCHTTNTPTIENVTLQKVMKSSAKFCKVLKSSVPGCIDLV